MQEKQEACANNSNLNAHFNFQPSKMRGKTNVIQAWKVWHKHEESDTNMENMRLILDLDLDIGFPNFNFNF